MAFYEGTPSKDGGGGDVRVSDDARVRVPLEHHIHHSPDGYAWGYTGSGPAELARCILWDHLGYEPHVLLYQLFKADVVAKWDGNDSWELRSGDIDDWLERNRSVPLLRETKGVSRRKSPLLSVLRF